MKKNLIILLTFVLIIVPLKVRALTGSISISCTDGNPGGTVACELSGSSDVGIIALKGTVDLPTGFTIKSFTLTSDWKENDYKDNKINPYIDTDDPISGNFKVGTLTIEVADSVSSSTYNIGLKDIYFYPEGAAKASISNASGNVYIIDGGGGGGGSDQPGTSDDPTDEPTDQPATESGLKSMSVTNGSFYGRQFSATDSDRSYNIMLESKDTTKFTIKAEAKNSSDAITAVNGDTGAAINLNDITFVTASGKSQMEIDISVGSGSNKVTYVLLIAKPTSKSADFELSSLTVGGKKVDLKTGVYDYKVTLDDVSEYVVTGAITDSTTYTFNEVRSLPQTVYGAGHVVIITEPRDSSSGLTGVAYDIEVVAASKQPASSSSPAPSSNVPTNPTTGSSAIIMAIILLLSFGASLYFYRKNMKEFE